MSAATRGKRLLEHAAGLLSLILLAWPHFAAAADSCTQSLCRSGETYRRATEPGAAYGWCHVERLTYEAHQRRSCEAGWTLQGTTGVCVKTDCCPEKPLCPAGDRYTGSGTSAGRTYGVCSRTRGTAKSHQLVYCEEGWRLDTARGVCIKLDCPASVTGGFVVPAPRFVAPPDLIVRGFRMRFSGACEPGKAVMTFSVTVANIGTGASPSVPGKALVRVRDGHGTWGNGASLPALAPGASATVEVPVYYLKSDPGHMTGRLPHPFRATADPMRLVTESEERNNDSPVMNVGAPPACATAVKR
jgi:hypothetical protein